MVIFHLFKQLLCHGEHASLNVGKRMFDNRLNAEVLGCLRAMGHGDVLIISDTNFPADQVARATVTGKLLRMENLTAAQAVNAVLSVLPLDTFVDDFAGRMEIVGDPT